MRFEERVDVAFQRAGVPATEHDAFHDRDIEPGQPERRRGVELRIVTVHVGFFGRVGLQLARDAEVRHG